MNRALMDYNPESEVFERQPGPAGDAEAGGLFAEIDEMELATGLLEAGAEPEIERFLARLIARAGRVSGQPINRPTAYALAGTLRAAARQALPATGQLPGQPRRAQGARAGRSAEEAGHYFGLELEGLSGEDQEFEVARSFVRFAGDAVRHVATAAQRLASPQGAVRTGVLQAARHHAPGLLRTLVRPRPADRIPGLAPPPAGRWVRRGRKLVIDNC